MEPGDNTKAFISNYQALVQYIYSLFSEYRPSLSTDKKKARALRLSKYLFNQVSRVGLYKGQPLAQVIGDLEKTRTSLVKALNNLNNLSLEAQIWLMPLTESHFLGGEEISQLALLKREVESLIWTIDSTLKQMPSPSKGSTEKTDQRHLIEKMVRVFELVTSENFSAQGNSKGQRHNEFVGKYRKLWKLLLEVNPTGKFQSEEALMKAEERYRNELISARNKQAT